MSAPLKLSRSTASTFRRRSRDTKLKRANRKRRGYGSIGTIFKKPREIKRSMEDSNGSNGSTGSYIAPSRIFCTSVFLDRIEFERSRKSQDCSSERSSVACEVLFTRGNVILLGKRYTAHRLCASRERRYSAILRFDDSPCTIWWLFDRNRCREHASRCCCLFLFFFLSNTPVVYVRAA